MVLAIGIGAGLIHAVVFPFANPEQVGIATDVYYTAATTMVDGGSFYQVSPPDHPAFSFRYPPVFVLAFLPHALLGSPFLAFCFQSLLNLGTVAVLAVLTIRFLDRNTPSFERIDAVLVAGYTVCSVPMLSNLVMGQVNVQLALAVAVAAIAIERGHDSRSGMAFGGAAAVKLFPTLFGVWLLRRRAWTAIAAACLTGVTAIVCSVLVFGIDSLDVFYTTVVTDEMGAATFPDGPDPHSSYLTIRRQVAILFPIPADWLALVGVVVLTPVVTLLNWSHDGLEQRCFGLFGVVLATLILFPLEPFYLVIAVFPLLATVYLLPPGRSRRFLLVGVVFLSIPLTYDSLLPVLHSPLVPGSVVTAVETVAKPVFGVVLPPMIGVWLVFIAGVYYQFQASDGDAASTSGEES